MTDQAPKELGSSEMMRRTLLSGFFALIATASPAAPPPVNPAYAVAFMNQCGTAPSCCSITRPTRPSGRRDSASCSAPDFDCPGIARFVFFEDYVVFMYTARLSNLGDEMKVRGSRRDGDGDGAIFSTDMISAGSTAPVKIDWRLVGDNGSDKIRDVIVEGVSMAVTQRSEFASVVQRNGNQLRGLLALMREKTASAAR